MPHKPRIFRSILSVGLVASACLSGLVVASGTALAGAGGSCSTAGGFNGYTSTGGAFEGVSTTLQTLQPSAFCTPASGNFNFSTAWVMMQPGTYGANLYAQSGIFLTAPSGYARIFAEWNNGSPASDYHRTFGPDQSGGSSHNYRVVYDTGGWFDLEYDSGTVIAFTNFNPKVAWNTPFSENWSSESVYQNTGIPGRSTSPEKYYHMSVQYTSNNAFSCCPPTVSNFDTSTQIYAVKTAVTNGGSNGYYFSNYST
jgi:hypothetical protein